MNGFEEIIFKHRNKQYGAFDLRRRYFPVLVFSVISTLVVFVISMLIINMEIHRAKNRHIENWYTYNVSGTGVNKYTDRKNQPPAGGSIHIPVYIPHVVDTVPAHDTLVNKEDGNGNDTTGHGNGNGNGNGNGEGPVFYNPQQQPSFPGGDIERVKFLQRNIVYPPQARLQKIHGKVYIAFIVEKDGTVSSVSLLHGIGYGCDDEALRVIKSMPRWEPGRQNGEPVRVYIRWPVVF